MSNISHQLEAVIAEKSLLNHPFYQAWSHGTLSTDSLKVYAKEYAGFIGVVAEGWRAAGDETIANVEDGHYLLWKSFARGLGNEEISSTLPAVNDLIDSCHSAFTAYPSALGALYAFEAQQPLTAKSKLEGLQSHYAHLKADERYFAIHVDDVDEPAMLLEKMNQLSPAEKAQALQACETVSAKLWDALSGIMDATAN